MRPYATTIAIWDRPSVRLVFEGVSTPNARTGAAIRLARNLLPAIAGDNQRGALFVQYDDMVHNDILSLGFCRRKGEAPAVQLIPDPSFLNTHGYKGLRDALNNPTLPPFGERRDVIFWRGTATNRWRSSSGAPVERLEQVPRVELCLKLRDINGADAAICRVWSFQFDSEMAMKWFTDQRIFRPPVSPLEQAQNRYLIDIDGVANAWGFFEKLLLGSCILKVDTDYEQWFYGSIAPWQHFVPVRADLSDLAEKIAWCREHADEAARIGARGQAFALASSYEMAQAWLVDAARQCFIAY